MNLDIPNGWRLWHLGQRTDGEWSALLYREDHLKVRDVFSASGLSRTPQGAINNCLRGPAHPHLFDGVIVRDEDASAVEKAAIAARRRLTEALG